MQCRAATDVKMQERYALKKMVAMELRQYEVRTSRTVPPCRMGIVISQSCADGTAGNPRSAPPAQNRIASGGGQFASRATAEGVRRTEAGLWLLAQCTGCSAIET
jgi:hypothetical protein